MRKLPAPSIDLSLRDKSGNKVAPGETGQLFVSSSAMMKHYLSHSPIDKHPVGAHGLATGEYFIAGDDETIRHVGREQDLITRANRTFSVLEAERLMESDQEFSQQIVFIRGPDNSLAAFVRRQSDESESFASERFLRRAHRALPETMMPDKVVVVPEFPLGSTGKVDRLTLSRTLHDA
jgi:acyl-coenzyme A synthetase/AMP-(fatty) acid ligase